MNTAKSERLDIVFSCAVVHIGLFVEEENGRFSLRDKWSVTLGRDGKYMTFDYFSGIGHRKPKLLLDGREKKQANKLLGGASLVQTRENYEDMKSEVDKYTQITALKIDDVLYCLLAESCAIGTDFEEWAPEFGYDADSRKAYKIWEACCDNGKKLKALIPDLEEAREKFQDY